MALSRKSKEQAPTTKGAAGKPKAPKSAFPVAVGAPYVVSVEQALGIGELDPKFADTYKGLTADADTIARIKAAMEDVGGNDSIAATLLINIANMQCADMTAHPDGHDRTEKGEPMRDANGNIVKARWGVRTKALVGVAESLGLSHYWSAGKDNELDTALDALQEAGVVSKARAGFLGVCVRIGVPQARTDTGLKAQRSFVDAIGVVS